MMALNMGGLHNIENATVAIAVARQLNIEPEPSNWLWKISKE